MALLLALWAHQDGWTQPYTVNNDAHQHTFWLHWAGDGQALESDLLALYASHYEPPLWVWGYRVLEPLLSPIWLGRVLPLLLFPLSALLLFWVTDRIDDRRAAFPWPALVAVGLFCISPFFLRKMAGGHPRAFATPFILATLWLLRNRRSRAQALLLVIQSLVYPISWLLSCATVASQWLRFERGRLRLGQWKLIAPLAVAIALGGFFLASRYLQPTDPRLGSPATGEQLSAESPAGRQLRRGGRTHDLPIPSLAGGYTDLLRNDLFRLRRTGSTAWPRRLDRRLFLLLIASLGLFALLALRRQIPFPPELVGLTLASCLLYFAADSLLLRLLLPRRYIMYSLALVTVIVLALLIGRGISALPSLGRKAAAVGLGVALLTFAPGIRGFGIDDYSPWGEAFELAAQLPANALIAASPLTADGIPLFAERHVLINYQMALPYFPTYWQSIEHRLDDLFAAYYAVQLEPLITLRQRHGVDFLIVDREDFDPAKVQGKPGIFFEPWRTQIQRRVTPKAQFLLLNLAPRLRSPASTSGRFFVVDLRQLLEDYS